MTEAVTREQLYDRMAAQHPDYFYCAVRVWNWSNGTWLLHWIASQPTCTRATAQRIFWGCEPEALLGVDGQEDWMDPGVHDLAALVLQNWRAGLYADDPRHRGDRLRASLLGRNHFRDDTGAWYAPDQIGWFNPDNPMAMMRSYRRAEAGYEPADLPWQVPDDLGELQRDRRPSWTAYDLVEGVPEEFVDLLD